MLRSLIMACFPPLAFGVEQVTVGWNFAYPGKFLEI